jgi:hypothetical protein
MLRNAAAEFAAFAEARGWKVGADGMIVFGELSTGPAAVPAGEVIDMSLQYAAELERIV